MHVVDVNADGFIDIVDETSFLAPSRPGLTIFLNDGAGRFTVSALPDLVTGDLDGAAAAYQEALRIDPAYARAHNNLGILLDRRRTKGVPWVKLLTTKGQVEMKNRKTGEKVELSVDAALQRLGA